MKTILITGAYGNVGTVITNALKSETEYLLKVTDIQTQKFDLQNNVQLSNLDIADFDAVVSAMTGVDYVIHLAGIANESTWDKLQAINVSGTYNILEAARLKNVKKVILASSNQTVGFYRNNKIIDNQVPFRPTSFYGVSKACMESLGRLYADKFGLSIACLRIGSLGDRPSEVRHLSTWLSHRDLVHLVDCSLKAKYHFIVVYGVSANKRSLWQNPDASLIGYKPRDNAENYVNDPLLIEARNEIGQQLQGGQFCTTNFTGNINNID